MHKSPFHYNYNDIDIFNSLIKANSKLGELNGVINTLPNPMILLNAVILGEAKNSSEIENIVTTFDQIFKEITLKKQDDNSKEVVHYKETIMYGYKTIKEKGFISTNIIEEMHHIIEPTVGEIRKIPGTVILNTKTKEILHTPPQSEKEIHEFLTNLENYINYDEMDNLDPLVKLALIHYQFESIHPFHDGNGRTGRILNVLFLVLKEKLSLPILYLSKYFNSTKNEYYKYLHDVRVNRENLKPYLLYMINGIYETSLFTINFIKKFNNQMSACENILKDKLPSLNKSDLINHLFFNFYTKNDYIKETLNVSRNTASKYLKELENIGILNSEKVGKEMLYKNNFLYNLMYDW